MNYSIQQGLNLFKHSIDDTPDQNDPDFKPHSHTKHYELFYFVSGDAVFNVDNHVYELRNGSLLLIKPGILHNIQFKSDKKYERIVIRFKESDITPLLAEKIKETENIYFVRNSELSNEILRLDVHFSNLDNDWVLFTFNNILQVILSYVVNYKPETENRLYTDEVHHMVNYIEDNLTDINTIDDICNALNISKSALCKKFTEGVGVPIMSFVRIRKCIMANSLIEKGEKPTKIYHQCGFKDYTTFYRTYKKLYQKEPSSLS